MLDTVVISGDDVCCSVVLGTLGDVFVFSVLWFELLMTSAISCPLWSSVYEYQRVECVMFVMYCMQCCIVRVICFVVSGCAVSGRSIHVCNCGMFSVVYVYLDHLKFCVMCIDDRGYVCCSECNVVYNECNEPTSCLVQPIGLQCCEVMYFGCFGFSGEFGFLNCDVVCMCVVNKQFERIEFVFDFFLFTCSMMRFLSLLLLGLCHCVVFVVMWSSLICV